MFVADYADGLVHNTGKKTGNTGGILSIFPKLCAKLAVQAAARHYQRFLNCRDDLTKQDRPDK
jgi:hypothetical protein